MSPLLKSPSTSDLSRICRRREIPSIGHGSRPIGEGPKSPNSDQRVSSRVHDRLRSQTTLLFPSRTASAAPLPPIPDSHRRRRWLTPISPSFARSLLSIPGVRSSSHERRAAAAFETRSVTRVMIILQTRRLGDAYAINCQLRSFLLLPPLQPPPPPPPPSLCSLLAPPPLVYCSGLTLASSIRLIYIHLSLFATPLFTRLSANANRHQTVIYNHMSLVFYRFSLATLDVTGKSISLLSSEKKEHTFPTTHRVLGTRS